MTGGSELDEYALRDLVRTVVASDVRHFALDTGRVRIEVGKAALEPRTDGGRTDTSVDHPRDGTRTTVDVTAPSVGIVRWGGNGGGRPTPGADVAAGEGLAELAVRDRVVPVPAPAAGRLVDVLVDDGEFVEYGQVLARLEARNS